MRPAWLALVSETIGSSKSVSSLLALIRWMKLARLRAYMLLASIGTRDARSAGRGW